MRAEIGAELLSALIGSSASSPIYVQAAGATTGTPSSVAASATDVTILAANASRDRRGTAFRAHREQRLLTDLRAGGRSDDRHALLGGGLRHGRDDPRRQCEPRSARNCFPRSSGAAPPHRSTCRRQERRQARPPRWRPPPRT